MNRRHFLSLTAASLGAPAASAIEPLVRPGNSRLVLGLAAYSFRNRMRWMKGKEQKNAGEKPWSIFDFIDYCANQGGIGAELTSYFFPPNPDEDFLLRVKRHAYLRGVAIAGTAVGNTFTHPTGPERDAQIAYVKEWIDHAAVMGAPHIRVFAGSVPKGLSEEQAVANCISAYQECLDYAGERGIFLGLENHHGIVAKPEGLLRIIKAVKSPWAGVNLDSGNFHTADPYADLAKIAPYAINVQVKDTLKPAGKDPEPMDYTRVISILEKANYQGWLTLEYEDGKDAGTAVPALLEKLSGLITRPS